MYLFIQNMQCKSWQVIDTLASNNLEFKLPANWGLVQRREKRGGNSLIEKNITMRKRTYSWVREHHKVYNYNAQLNLQLVTKGWAWDSITSLVHQLYFVSSLFFFGKERGEQSPFLWGFFLGLFWLVVGSLLRNILPLRQN